MTKKLNQRRVIFFGSLFLFVIIGGFFLIRLAQGYRVDLSDWSFNPHGVLVATSIPNGAQLFVDEKLISATNTTVNLTPGEYEVEIKKDGFSPWKKTLLIQKELVTKAEAFLFPAFPDLRPLTFTGASNPAISPDGQKVVFVVSDALANKDGLWVLDLADRPLGFPRSPRQIVESAPRGRDFAQSAYVWSPDSEEILVTLQVGTVEENFLLEAGRLNPSTELVDVSPVLSGIYRRWEEEKAIREEAKLSEVPEELLEILQDTTKDLTFSPDESKIFYTATASATIPEELIPPLPSPNSQPESREIEPGKIYAYDLEEDKNFFLMDEDKNQSLSWFSTSNHLFLVQNDKISVFEYDNTNWVDLYTGPFENSFAFPFPSGNKILILTSLGQDTPPNLYAISLR